MKSNKSMIWIISFIFMMVFPTFIYSFLGKYVDSDNHENRNIESKPTLTVENYNTFSKDYEAYYNDNLPFRNQLIGINNSIDYYIFRKSTNENVCIGKDGWLFYCNNSDGNPVEQSLGWWNFTDSELEIIAENLLSTKSVLESRGIEFILFIAPNKETIYLEELPDYYTIKNQYTATDCLVDYLRENTDIRVIYPKDELLTYKSRKDDLFLYHKLDTHWNYAGAYIGAWCLAKELGIEMPSLDEISMIPISSSRGDLTDMLNITISNGDVDYKNNGINESGTETVKRDFSTEFIYYTPGADQRKLFVCRDSFSTAMAPIMATQFENSLWVHTNQFDQEQIFDYDADVFVLEVAERYERTLTGFRISNRNE